MLFRLLAVVYNALPVRWQRRILDRTQARFVVGVVGLGVDPNGHVILARHRFGAPEWRFLGGFLSPRERLEDALAREVREETGVEIEVGPILEANQGYRWQRVEIVYDYRPIGGIERLSGGLDELRGFGHADLPGVCARPCGTCVRRCRRGRASSMTPATTRCFSTCVALGGVAVARSASERRSLATSSRPYRPRASRSARTMSRCSGSRSARAWRSSRPPTIRGSLRSS